MPSAIPLPYPASSIDLFQKLRHLPLPVLLHSGSYGENAAARFDIMVAAPSKTFRYKNGVLLVTSSNNKTTTKVDESRSEQISEKVDEKKYTKTEEQISEEIETQDPFSVLANYLAIQVNHQPDVDYPFCGGLVGYFAYDTLHELNKVKVNKFENINLPSVLAGIYDWAVLVDHKLQRCSIVSEEPLSDQQTLELSGLLISESKKQKKNFHLNSSFISNCSLQDYEQGFNKVMEYIRAGDCYQVNLAQCFQASCEGDSYSAFVDLQELANAPFSAYIEDGEQSVLSFSPERFLQVQNKHVTTQPIKGTRPRFNDPKEDQEALNDLKASKKDQAENLMIVDLLRNDLGKVCVTGSINVESLFEAHSFNNVHHLISTISGDLERESDVFSLLGASFPGGSITGTPKKRAMEVIDEIETVPRSVYCGSILWLGFDGNMDSNIAIRTLVRDQEKIYCWGGGGLVADSDMQQEYQESLDKISLFINAFT